MMSNIRRLESRGILVYLLIALAVLLSYILFALLLKAEEPVIRLVMLILVILGLVSVAFKKKDKLAYFIVIIIAIGVVMRIGYMLYTPFGLRGHDVGGVEGHFAYVFKLFAYGQLPDTNAYQFYHPPFQHILEAITVKFFSLFQTNTDIKSLFEATKLVPCFASCAIMPVSFKICKEMKLPRQATAIALTIIAFHPTFYILSASINNDAVMLLLFMAAVLYTIRWYYRPTMKNIALIGLFIGLAMMTKLSAGMVALFTAPIFFAVFMREWRKKKWKGIFAQFGVFALICFPLALWYPIRNLILFDQPFGYVVKITESSTLFCGNNSIAERFFSFPFDQMLNPVYCSPHGDCNIWLYTLKSSVFGEFTFDLPDFYGKALIITNAAMIVLSLIAMVYVMARMKKLNKFARYGLGFIWLVQMVSFIVFNVQYPYGCTMDYRYIMPTCIVGAVYIGIVIHEWEKGSRLKSVFCIAAGIAVALFALSSILFYASVLG